MSKCHIVGIHMSWLLYMGCVMIDLILLYVNDKGANQTGYQSSLLSTFVIWYLECIIFEQILCQKVFLLLGPYMNSRAMLTQTT